MAEAPAPGQQHLQQQQQQPHKKLYEVDEGGVAGVVRLRSWPQGYALGEWMAGIVCDGLMDPCRQLSFCHNLIPCMC